MNLNFSRFLVFYQIKFVIMLLEYKTSHVRPDRTATIVMVFLHFIFIKVIDIITWVEQIFSDSSPTLQGSACVYKLEDDG